MQESVSGFKVTGSWADIVEHGERITEALERADVDEEAFEAWEEWRPKAGERLDEGMSRKTSEQASVAEGEGERAGESVEEDLHSAGEKLSESYDRIGDEDESARETVRDSIDYATRAADTAGRRTLRVVEDAVYRELMTRVGPHYFDSDLISANIGRTNRFEDGEEFVFEVDINDDDLKAAVSERLAEYEDAVDRWHIDTDPETTASEAAKGTSPT